MQSKKALLKNVISKAAIAVFWLFVWWILYYFIDRPAILESPAQTFLTLLTLFIKAEFWYEVIFSLLRIILGLLIGCIAAIMLSVFTLNFKAVDAVFKPILKHIKTVPIVPIIMLLWLFFFRYSNAIPFIIASLTVLPIMCSSLSEAYETFDQQLLEMARCCAKPLDIFIYVRLPHLFPYFISGLSASIKAAWNASIAAEVICGPIVSIGREIELARNNLESDKLLAWTIVVVLLSMLLETLLVNAIKNITFRPKLRRFETPASNGQSYPIIFDHISKHYNGNVVLSDFSYVFQNGKITAILGQPSCGKTTLLSIAASLETDDHGRYQMPPTAPGIIFQENRLIPGLTVAENILFANKGANINKILSALSLNDISEKYPNELNEDIQRRVAIGRAIAFGGGIGIFDEPFSNLDDDTKALCAQALFSAYKGKTVIFVTQNGDDAERYADEILKMS